MNKLRKIIEYSFYLFLIVLPIQTRWIFREGSLNDGYFEYGNYSLYGTDILLLFIVLAAAFYFWRDKSFKDKLKFNKLWFFLACFELIAFVSIFFSIDKSLAFYKYLVLLLAIALFAFVSYFPLKKTKLMIALSVSVFIQSMVAIAQFIYQHSPGNKWLGLAEKIPYELGISVVEAMGDKGYVERWLRSHGTLDHPNMLGGFLLLSFVLIFSFLILRSKAIYKKEDNLYRSIVFRYNLYLYPLIVFISIALFFSFSRAAWLALVVFLATFLFFISVKKDKLSQKFFLPVLLYIGLILFVTSYPFMNLVEARLMGKSKVEYISKVERFRSVKISEKILKDNWHKGVGLGNYPLEMHSRYAEEKSYFYQPVHNTFLLVWSELGILGILSFLLFLFYAIVRNSKLQKVGAEYKYPLLFAIVILLFFDHWLFSLHFGLYFLFLFLALIPLIFKLDND